MLSNRRAAEGGFTLVPALAIITILFMLAVTFLHGVFRFQATKTKHEQRSMTAGNIAETGIHRSLSQLAAAIASDSTATTLHGRTDYFSNTNHQALQRTVSDPVTGEIIGSFDATYENGDITAGGKTATGSTTAGQDLWGNQIWYTTDNYQVGNNMRRFGLRVDGYATYPDGQRKPGGQSVYVRALMNSPQSYANLDQPANYLLFTNASLTIVNGAGLYGGITHTNNEMKMQWQAATTGSHQHAGAIDAYSPLGYGTFLGYWYFHSHNNAVDHQHTAAINNATRPWTTDLGTMASAGFGYSYNVADYFHTHPIASTAIAGVLASPQFFNFGTAGAANHPTNRGVKNFPVLSLASLLQVTKPTGGTAIADTDYAKGYWVGNADFRAHYFGSNLLATADTGSPPVLSPTRANASIADIALIAVNDNKASANYMKVSMDLTKCTSDATNYHAYTYRQIPPNNVLLVRDGEVKIGNFRPVAPAAATANVAGLFGGNTIIDGRLTIVSYATTTAGGGPTSGPNIAPNAGDILICGNVIYKNRMYTDQLGGARQYKASDNTAPSSISQAGINWVSTTTGAPVTSLVNGEAVPVGNVCGLGLFAANNMRIALDPYLNDASMVTDNLDIMAELIAGANPNFTTAQKAVDTGGGNVITNPAAQYRLKQDSTPANSTRDTLKIWGSISSLNLPRVTYWSDRDYVFDKSLSAIPLPGQPLMNPNATYANVPVIIPGSWGQMTAP